LAWCKTDNSQSLFCSLIDGEQIICWQFVEMNSGLNLDVFSLFIDENTFGLRWKNMKE